MLSEWLVAIPYPYTNIIGKSFCVKILGMFHLFHRGKVKKGVVLRFGSFCMLLLTVKAYTCRYLLFLWFNPCHAVSLQRIRP